MNVFFDGFEWDEGNREKCKKHGVSLEEIETLMRAKPLVLPDILHSSDEERYKAVGKSLKGKSLFMIFTIRQKDGKRLLRPISARYMHKKEVQHYEKNSETISNL